jgi:hypothetical protein
VVQFGKDNMTVHFYDFLVENKKKREILWQFWPLRSHALKALIII